MNPQGPTQDTICNYESANSLTAGAGNTGTVIIPATSTDNEVDLAAMFPAMTGPIFVSVQDVTNPDVTNVGLLWGTAAGEVTQSLGAGGFIAWLADGSTALASLFCDNTNGDDLVLQVGVMSN
jgi:hypothetical protein